MNVFITGATGLLGINTIHELLKRGHFVTALVRNTEKAGRVLPRTDRIKLINGDMDKPDDWIPKMQSAEALIHTAAYFREYFGAGDHAEKLQAWNVRLPVRLTQAASDFGLKKTVMVSSSGTVYPRPDGKPDR